jgi:hypothetical protein
MTIQRPGWVLIAALGFFIAGVVIWSNNVNGTQGGPQSGPQQPRPKVGSFSLPEPGTTLEQVIFWPNATLESNSASAFKDVTYRGIQEASGKVFFVFVGRKDGVVTLLNADKVGVIDFKRAKGN